MCPFRFARTHACVCLIGPQHCAQISKVDKESINETIYAPQTRDLLRVQWNGDEYHLVSSTGFSARSSVTDCEDVSYVSSAYVPVCLRKGGLSV